MLLNTYRFCQLASLFGRIENFIVEDRKIERESQPNWMGRLHFGLADVVSVLVSFLRIIDHFYWKSHSNYIKYLYENKMPDRTFGQITIN